MERWEDKVAVVTGASSGIGACIAEKLVECGMKVVGLARRADRVDELAKKLTGKRGKLYSYKADMTVESDIKNAFKWASTNLGPVHVLINNAGILQTTSLIGGDAEKWKLIMDTNVIGLCIATREAVDIMMANKIDGHIVHINSITGQSLVYFPNINVYGASKYAVTNLAGTLRKELMEIKSRIKISSISPGIVETEIFENATDFKDFVEVMPHLRPIDIANAVKYVLETPPHVQIQELTIKPILEDL